MGTGLRIKELIENKGITPYIVSAKTGVSQSTLSRILNDNSKKLNIENTKILAEYFNVSEEWLTTGEGTKERFDEDSDKKNVVVDGIPIYDTDFMAGSVNVFENEKIEIIGHLNLPELKGTEQIIRAKGDSMIGVIDDRDFIGIKRINDFSFFNYGSPYAIVTSDYRLLKFIRKSENPDNIILRSSNPEYDDIELPKSKILELYIITAVLPFSKIKTFM